MTDGLRRLPVERRDLLVLAGLLGIAAVLRFVELPVRGTWDADQGHDLLVLRGLTRGEIPLLGPPTSIGTFHHGVLYYYLLAPVALLSGADPTAVVAAIALGGTMAVGVTWWLARAIGGPIAGAAAGLLMAVSAAAVEESTFIWNPNLIALSSSIALAAAWRAWTGGRPGWWVVALAATVVTMHCHVLGAAMLGPIGALLVVDLRRASGERRRAITRAALAGLGLLVLSYVPLAIHELGHDFAESRALAAFVLGGGDPSGVTLPLRFVIVTLRVLAWPLTGLITDVPAAALLSTGLVLAIVVWRWRAIEPAERVAVRWLGLALLWTIAALTVAASSLATVIPGLPNDHYHAFADPIVVVLVGLGVAALARVELARRPLGRLVAAAVLVGFVGFNLVRQPALVSNDGGWPAAARTADQVGAITGDRPILLAGVPTFKKTDTLGYPLVRAGRSVVAAQTADAAPAVPPGAAVVITCDRLFEEVVGTPCDGPAEDERAAPWVDPSWTVQRFPLSARTTVSVYLPPD